MRKLVVIFVLAIAVAIGHAQVWEKLVAPGLTYRMEIDPVTPQIIHALRWTPDSTETRAEPVLAGDKVFGIDASGGRDTVSSMVAQNKAIAGINADFFPWSGDPVGLMIRNGELLSRPYPNRSFVAWGGGKSLFTTSGFSAKIKIGAEELLATGWNEENLENAITINTEHGGLAKSKVPAAFVVIEISEDNQFATGKITGTVKKVLHGATSYPTDENLAVIVGSGQAALKLESMAEGANVEISWVLSQPELKGVQHAIAGGPILLRNGKILSEWSAEGFNDKFALHRHPRTAVGRTQSGYLWFVAIDGRSELSSGATLEETARILLRLGCTDAVNLDGGGSTTLNVLGITVNRPSDGKERPVANGIVFFGPDSESGKPNFKISGPDSVSLDETKGLQVMNESEGAISNSEVIWSAEGAGWIDQGGYLRPSKVGEVTVRACCRGKTITKSFEILKQKKRT
jgi:exopolysaccharide biosynthesis protein